MCIARRNAQKGATLARNSLSNRGILDVLPDVRLMSFPDV
jgi:hypothetical protein